MKTVTKVVAVVATVAVLGTGVTSSVLAYKAFDKLEEALACAYEIKGQGHKYILLENDHRILQCSAARHTDIQIVRYRQTVCLHLDGFLEDVTRITGVTEVTVLMSHCVGHAFFQLAITVFRNRVLVLLRIHAEDINQFLGTIVGEVDVTVET